MSHRNVVWEKMQEFANRAKAASEYVHDSSVPLAQRKLVETWFDEVETDLANGCLDVNTRLIELNNLIPA